MGLYEQISRYYDIIFPVGKEQISFLVESTGKPPKKVMDVACGTGGYAVELAKLGYDVTAVDIDAQMVEAAREKAKAEGAKIRVVQVDMLSLSGGLGDEYDLIFCIGNSLVHLGGRKEIGQFLSKTKRMLKNGGCAVFQIINYDRVLDHGVTSLPMIENEAMGLRFERNYILNKAMDTVLFKTKLCVDGTEMENVISLYPLVSSEFEHCVEQAGFTDIKTYGDFSKGKFDGSQSFMTVIWAK